MDWALENWFWILILVVFAATHLFGHGGHGGHGGHRGHDGSDGYKKTNKKAQDEVHSGRTANKHSDEHQH